MKKYYQIVLIFIVFLLQGCATQKRILELEKRINKQEDRIYELQKRIRESELDLNDLKEDLDIILDSCFQEDEFSC